MVKTDKRTRVRACPDCALLAESVPLAVRLTHMAERAAKHADALEDSVMTLPESRRPRRWAAIRRWRGLAHTWRKRAREARGTVEYRCTACALRASMDAVARAAWSSAGETGVVTLADGTTYGAPEMHVPYRAGKYGPPDATITLARVRARAAVDGVDAGEVLSRKHGRTADAETRTLVRVMAEAHTPIGAPMVIPVDADALADGREIEARTDWQTLAPGERIDGLRIVRDGWSHVRPAASGPASRCVVNCPCGQRYVMGLSHVCEYVQRAGTLRVEHRREDGSRKSASAQSHERRARKSAAMKAEIARMATLTAEARAREIVAAAAPVEDYRDTAH